MTAISKREEGADNHPWRAALEGTIAKQAEEITKLRGDLYAANAAARAAVVARRESELWRALQDIPHNDKALAIRQVEALRKAAWL